MTATQPRNCCTENFTASARCCRQSAIMLAIAAGLVAGECRAEVGGPRTVARLMSGEPVTVVCFGDSVTGLYYHTGGRRAYTEMLGIALQRLYPRAQLKMINAGISGHATTNGLERLERDVLRHRPTLVTVMFGLNDMVRVPLEQYRANLATIVQRCREVGAEVVLCTPNNVISTSGRPTEKLITYCNEVRAAARELQVPLADCYAELERDRERDPRAWRLLLSDEIHPNMDGHQRLAEIIAQTISGQAVSVADVPPPPDPLRRTRQLLKEQKPVQVLAMTPCDAWLPAALQPVAGQAQLKITPWPTAGQSLPALEADAKARVRALRPDLVVVAIPRSAAAPDWEAYVRAHSWVLNWSLSFGQQEWDCLVVHPSVVSPDQRDPERDSLARTLVMAQDLFLLDRRPGDNRSGEELLREFVASQFATRAD